MPGSRVILTDCTVEGSKYGLRGYQANARAINTTFDTNYWGLYLRYCDTYYSHDNVFTGNTRGAYLYGCSVPLDDNQFTNNQYGLYSINSSGVISNNTFTGNTTAGLYLVSSSTQSLNDWQRLDILQVNNLISNNGTYGVYIDGSSTPNLGTYQIDFSKPDYSYGGFNSFNRGASGYDVYSLNSSTIKAEANWWTTSNNYGSVDIIPNANSLEGGIPLAKVTGGTDLNPIPQQILSADKMVADSLYTDAIEKYQSYIDQYPTDEWALTALGRIVQTAKLAKLDPDWYDILNDNELISILDDIYTTNSIYPVGLQALDYSVAVSVTLGNPTDALVRNEELLTRYSQAEYNDEDVAFAMLEQAVIQELLEEEGLSKTGAESGYQKVIDTYPQSLAAIEAQLLLNKPTVEPTGNVNIPNDFVLYPAYPNPFNPITQLRYNLPEQSFVQIAIYDLLGRQVTSLVNQTQEAGYKSVQWNGTNQVGQPVSAGVYLYQVKAGDFIQTRKMVLLK